MDLFFDMIDFFDVFDKETYNKVDRKSTKKVFEDELTESSESEVTQWQE